MIETIALRNPHTLGIVEEEMKLNPRIRNATEAAESLIADGRELRQMKRLGAQKPTTTEQPRQAATTTREI